jgi:hypothetical protein
MLLPKKLIFLAIIIHVVTIIACASLQPKEVEKVNEQRMEQQQMEELPETQLDEDATSLEQ